VNVINLSTNVQPIVWFHGGGIVATGSIPPGVNVQVPFGEAVDSVSFPLSVVPVAGWMTEGTILIDNTQSVFLARTSPQVWHVEGQGIGWAFVSVMILVWAVRRGLNPSLPNV